MDNENKNTEENVNEKETPVIKTEANTPVVTEEAKTENNKFEEKAESQVNKILKDISTVSFQGSKSDLSNEEVESIISELREATNITKKQFAMSVDKKDSKKFGVVKQPVAKAIKEIKMLGDLAERHSGEFSEEHVKAIFEVIKKKTNELKKELNSKDKKDDNFSF